MGVFQFVFDCAQLESIGPQRRGRVHQELVVFAVTSGLRSWWPDFAEADNFEERLLKQRFPGEVIFKESRGIQLIPKRHRDPKHALPWIGDSESKVDFRRTWISPQQKLPQRRHQPVQSDQESVQGKANQRQPSGNEDIESLFGSIDQKHQQVEKSEHCQNVTLCIILSWDDVI